MKIKTLMSLAAAAALVVPSAGITAHGEAGLYMIGDVNGDGTVDATDASAVLAAYASISSGHESPLYSYQESAADLNGDCLVDAIDASLILSYYACVSAGDEEAILTDFLEQHGFKQKMTDEDDNGVQGTSAPSATESETQQPLDFSGLEYTHPRIDSDYSEWFWIGDSRTVGLSYSVAIDYLGEIGVGIALLNRNHDSICQIRNKTVIFNLGVNDLHNSGAYLNWYNNLPDEFLDNNTVIVMSVNPCSGSSQGLNSGIESFNAKLRDGLDSRITFLDSYTYLNVHGFATTDGLHYTSGTYVDIYNFVYDSIYGA